MSEITLPPDWKENVLRDVARINYGKSPASILSIDGQIPVVGTGGVERYGTAFLHDGESIILGRKGTIDKVNYVSGKFWTIDTAFFLDNFQETDVRWLYYFLQTVDLRRMNEATGVPSLSREALYKIKIPKPSRTEQTQIAAILSTIDKAIAQTEAIIAKQQRIKTSLMQDLLTRGIDEHGAIRTEATHAFKDSPLGRIPVEWEVVLVGKVFEMRLGKMLSQASKTGRNPFPYLANRNVQWGYIDLSELEEMDFSDSEVEKYRLKPGDLLVCEGGEVGRTAIWQGEMENCFFQKAIHRLRARNNSVLPGYMLRYMRFAAMIGLFSDYTSQTSIAHLTGEKLAILPLVLPSYCEQHRIVESLDTLDKAINLELTRLNKLSKTKTGLMQDLLTGKVRVTDLFSQDQSCNLLKEENLNE